MYEAVIVACGRSPIGRANKGTLKDTRPEDLAAQVLKGVLAQVPKADPKSIEDFVLGCAFPEAEQGLNVARMVWLRAGLPVSVPGQTVNRFCASGLQSIAIAAANIRAGMNRTILAGGVESMSTVPMAGNVQAPNPWLAENNPDAYISMGITAENVAEKYGVSREDQDAFAAESHRKAAEAQAAGKFDSQIIPIDAKAATTDKNGLPSTTTVKFEKDECIRPDTTAESLSKLKPVFKMGGTVTAGNASPTNDGAAMVLMMSSEEAKKRGLKPLARFAGFAVAGVDPAYMGIGPVEAIPKALKSADLKLSDIDLIELNEAFAAQSIACIRELKLDPEKTNVNGGAIALGHPLGCSGAYLTTKLICELIASRKKYGIVSMCIGGGMGAAAVFEKL
ncbi:MAG: thiolase family protein [Clostridiales Family XIII bacterium]|jgi:acetyl-CoA acyltransferase|nr:thiolase family protein [Clostridiales Family XIII bacterium]